MAGQLLLGRLLPYQIRVIKVQAPASTVVTELLELEVGKSEVMVCQI